MLRPQGSRLRRFAPPLSVAALAVAVAALVLVPATAQAQDDGFAFDPRAACPVDAPEGNVADREAIPADHVRNVECAAFLELAGRSDDSLLRSSRPVPRDRMASLLARTLEAAGVALPDPSEGREFTDVGADNPHRDDIRRLEAAGVVTGGPLDASQDEFGPGLPSRRDQLASLVVRSSAFAMDEDVAAADQGFDDVADSNVHAGHIAVAAERGLLLGPAEGTYGPGRPVRGHETAAAVARLTNVLAVPAAVAVTGEPPGPVPADETVTVTAAVFSQFRDAVGDAAAWQGGEAVTFSAEHEDGAGVVTPEESQTVSTDENGEARFAFASREAGTVTVSASIDGLGGNFAHADGARDTVELAFVSAAPAAPAEGLELTPETATIEGSGSHTVQATLAEGGEPAPRRPVRFEVYREGDETFALSEAVEAQPRVGVASTGRSGGAAGFSYTLDRDLEDGERVEHLVIACEARDESPCVSIISGTFDERPHDTAQAVWVGGEAPD